MSEKLYYEIMKKLNLSAGIFLREGKEVSGEISEDFSTIIDDYDISGWKSNIDGTVR